MNNITNIVCGVHEHLNYIVEYFDFNQITYQSFDFWNTEFNVCVLPDEMLANKNCLLILNYREFLEFCSCVNSKNQLIEFLNSNFVWVWNDIDAFVDFLEVRSLTDGLNLNSLTFFLDAVPSDLNLVNLFNYQIFPYSPFLYSGRIKNSTIAKVDCKYDFLLTTVVKDNRPHRKILKECLSMRPKLLQKGQVKFHDYFNKTTDWIGDRPHQHDWADGFPAMDLYKNSWIEIVPETLCDSGHFITEKTSKPIMTQTPALFVSSAGYLDNLHSVGFKTFNQLIDESYDREVDLRNRIDKMLDQLQYIVNHGAESFYRAASTVLEHNQKRLFEISGSRKYYLDCFIKKNLEDIGFC
jgi:hypothetical protein